MSGRSAYGLSTRRDDWWTLAACGDRDPDMWVVRAGGLSPENRAAINLCHSCPVRVKCRDDTLGGPRPAAVIAGGWRWNFAGNPTPAVGDEHLLPTWEPPPGRGARAAKARRFVAAGREYSAGAPVDQVCGRHGLSRSVVYSAVRLIRYGDEALVARVEAGELTIHAGLSAIASARAAR